MNMIKSWDELSRQEQLVAEYWDFYKEVHGFRPRFMNLTSMSEQELEQELADLQVVAARVFEDEKHAEDMAIKKFETTVSGLCKSMNKDRATMVRWMFEGSNCNGDWDFYCYELGVPYGYFKDFSMKEAA